MPVIFIAAAGFGSIDGLATTISHWGPGTSLSFTLSGAK
jgi:hypothetical protein